MSWGAVLGFRVVKGVGSKLPSCFTRDQALSYVVLV